ncbi:hypothetical protein L0F63_003463 [Massospora cicadina]|nr:hypothetical protein L0F63_003463 [Massospora cicadina]
MSRVGRPSKNISPTRRRNVTTDRLPTESLLPLLYQKVLLRISWKNSSKGSSKKKKKKSKGKKSKSKKSHRKDSKRDFKREEGFYDKYKLKSTHRHSSSYAEDPFSSPLTSEADLPATSNKRYAGRDSRQFSPTFEDYSSPSSGRGIESRRADYLAAPAKLLIRLPAPVRSAPSSPLTPDFWQNDAPESTDYRYDPAFKADTTPLSEPSSIFPEPPQQVSPFISLSVSDSSPKVRIRKGASPAEGSSNLESKGEASDNSSQLPLSEHFTPLTASSPAPSPVPTTHIDFSLDSVAPVPEEDLASEPALSAQADPNTDAPTATETTPKPRAKKKRKALFRLNPLKRHNQAKGTPNENDLEFSKPAPKVMKELKGVISKLLETACKRDKYGVFLEPVNPEEVPDYHTVIKHPMDFGTMRANIEKSVYRDLDSFLSDFRLVCSNAMTYNDPSTVYYKLANRILELGLAAAEKERPYIIQDPAASEPLPKEEAVDVVGNPPVSNCPSPSVETPAAEPPMPQVAPLKKKFILRKATHGGRPPLDGSFDPCHFQPHKHACPNLPKLEPAWVSRKAPYVEGADYPAGFLHFGPFPTLKPEPAPTHGESSYLTWGDTAGVAYATSIATFVSGLGPEIQKLAGNRLNDISLHTYDIMKNTRRIVTASLAAKAKARST